MIGELSMAFMIGKLAIVCSDAPLSLSGALDVWASPIWEKHDHATNSVGLLLIPGGFVIARVEIDAERPVLASRDGPLSPDLLATVYEARLFSCSGKPAELRWLQDGQGLGRAALLVGDAPKTWQVKDWTQPARHPVVGVLSRTALIWGWPDLDRPDAAWTRLTAGRIGAIDVPQQTPGVRARLHLRSIELLTEEDLYGNTMVLGEMITGWEWMVAS